ncbi:hypothetical protein PGAG_00207 [Phaeocystis globosa virus 12T]|uniref:Uncharacterized protein n=1 Tax=Phaeocystis globosa virus PgV-16T TaxID=3071227 RepID=A0AC59EXA4_9VIRU|nr:hypothetical protein PGCG_00247 [Phaeocystis globosa virus]AET73096.1 hypothetical protein PGAG_00207 [Phaeocystis globosa virus 12T]AET73918.1 hypothetical protein PGBG_00210 [Phaeocystis globosa virus 14T]AGM15558.1 hypothetical protein PGCG_00247 [Phaeocystis globosa virus PgV-16T]UYE94288.1 hypothetical protein PGV14T_00247 [Phaeocystis globosa virus]
MVYTDIVDASRTHFILISSNYNDADEFIGTKVNIKTWIPDKVITTDNTNFHYEFDTNKTVFNEANLSSDKFKDRVILSARINDTNERPITLLTQQNLAHNIKFINKDNDFTQPRIIFTKYNVTNKVFNNNQHLLNPPNNNGVGEINLKQINLLDVSLNIDNTNNDVVETTDNTYKNFNRLYCYFNIYKPFVNSDYYKFKLTDFVDISFALQKDPITSPQTERIKVNPKLVTVVNNFASNTMVNYDETDFKQLFYYKDSNNNMAPQDVSLVLPVALNTNLIYQEDNILLHNKFDNISRIKLDLIYPDSQAGGNIVPGYSDICINFVVNKEYDNKPNTYGKIYLTSDFTYLNARVLDHDNDFYSFNADDFSDKKVYLSLGNSITGITQRDLFTKMKLEMETDTTITPSTSSKKIGNVKKIYFSKHVNSSNIETEIRNRKYLLNENYDYNYDSILYNNIQESSVKIGVEQNLLDYYHGYTDDFSYNIYNSRFNSLGLLNNEISSNQFDMGHGKNGGGLDISYQSSNNNFYITDRADLSYNSLNNKLRFNDFSIDSGVGEATLINTPISNNQISYDYRYNYDKTFYNDLFLTINYDYGSDIKDLSFNTLPQYGDNLVLNFHKIILTSEFTALPGSDFTNVDCVFIYHDPYDERTPEEFQYPYNNIEISNNPNIDSLSRAIVLLPAAVSSVTNTTFIPAKNGSNLSRKHIQGLVGMNNVPALLSVLPYDEDSILGRGFVNQYQITDECKTYTERVEDKLNSQKHISVKQPVDNTRNVNSISKSTNFANVVRSRGRNQSNRLSAVENCKVDPATITNYKTPFTNPMWRRSR